MIWGAERTSREQRLRIRVYSYVNTLRQLSCLDRISWLNLTMRAGYISAGASHALEASVAGTKAAATLSGLTDGPLSSRTCQLLLE
jgi:hypothetical protein